MTCAEDNRLKILQFTSYSAENKRNIFASAVNDCWSSLPGDKDTLQKMASLSTVVDCLQTVEMHHSGVRSLDTFESLEKESSVVLSVGVIIQYVAGGYIISLNMDVVPTLQY